VALDNGKNNSSGTGDNYHSQNIITMQNAMNSWALDLTTS